MRTILLRLLQKQAETRSTGYYEACLEAGTVEGDKLKIDDVRFHALRKEYGGIGTAFAQVAKPVARTLDAVLGTHLLDCKGCSERLNEWNSLTKRL